MTEPETVPGFAETSGWMAFLPCGALFGWGAVWMGKW